MTILSEIKVGQQVTLTIGVQGDIEANYFGTVALINAEKTRIQLKDVVFCRTGKKFSGVKQFYLPEILSIKIDDQNESSQPASDTATVDVDDIKFELSPEESEAIQTLIKDHCTIESAGDQLDKALDNIFHYHFVGLDVDGVEGRRGWSKIKYIVCSTPHKIYGFNVKKIGTIDDRFKEFLESDTHIKVVHDATSLTDNLLDCYGIRLRGVFDTMAVHKLLSHIPLSPELKEKLDSPTETSISRTAILLKFHDFLTEQLLRNAYESFQRNLDCCRNKDSVEVQMIYRNCN